MNTPNTLNTENITTVTIENSLLKRIIESALLVAGEPVSFERIQQLFDESQRPSSQTIRAAIAELSNDYKNNPQSNFQLIEVASGYSLQVKSELLHWINRLWEERPAKYSRAFLETLALIAYRQPVTRADIEDIRGVGVSSNIIKTLLEREWIRAVGHRDVPGRPALYATTKQFLDYFNLKNLEQLPTLVELQNIMEIGGAVQNEKGKQLEKSSDEKLTSELSITEELFSEESTVVENIAETVLTPQVEENPA